MASFTLKNIPDDLHQELREQAKLHRRSLNSEILTYLEIAVGLQSSRGVRSEISKDKRENTLQLSQQMTPEERLVAFFDHSRLIAQIHQAGVNFRAQGGF